MRRDLGIFAPSLILSACLVLWPLAAAARSEGADSNLALNPSFEKPAQDSHLPADWWGDREVYRRVDGAGRDGSAALRYSNDDPTRYQLASQRIPLLPGRKYRFSGWVKTEEVAGDESGATLCVEWSNKEGKWLGGAYPSGVKGTRDWTKITGVAKVPEEASGCTLSCYVRRGMTGTAWFDDVEVSRVYEPPLRTVLTSPIYRGRITDAGPATIRAVTRLDLRDCEVPPQELSVRGTLIAGADQETRAEIRHEVRLSEGRVAPVVLELPGAELTPGQYRLEIALLDSDQKRLHSTSHDLTRLPQDFRPACAIDEHRRLLVGGKPYFPLGMYWSSINEEDLRLYGDSKFNCLMPYGSPNREQMDLAQKHGLKVIYSIKDWYAGSRWSPSSIITSDDEEPMVRNRVREFRDHPALLAWYLNDELPQTYLPQLKAHQRWVCEDDPNHPTWVVLYQVNQVASYIDTFDVIGTDPYPIGRKPASMAADWTAETFRQVERTRPLWQVPQLHNWANYQKVASGAKEPRTPTYEEVRSMAWQCITEGATGLVFYSWYDVRRNPDVSFDEQWAGLKRIAEEIDRMTPVILSVEPAPGVTINDGQPPKWLHWLVRCHGGKTFLLAVNDGDGEGMVTFEFPNVMQEVRELSEGRAVPADPRGFSERFDPLRVRLYEIRLR